MAFDLLPANSQDAPVKSGNATKPSLNVNSGRVLGRHSAEPVARPRPFPPGMVRRVRQGAAVNRQEAAADTFGQSRPQSLQLGYALVDPLGPPTGEPRPIAARGDAVGRQPAEFRADLLERQPDPLGKDDEGDPPQHGAR